jgi:hypothetical protein
LEVPVVETISTINTAGVPSYHTTTIYEKPSTFVPTVTPDVTVVETLKGTSTNSGIPSYYTYTVSSVEKPVTTTYTVTTTDSTGVVATHIETGTTLVPASLPDSQFTTYTQAYHHHHHAGQEITIDSTSPGSHVCVYN